MADHVNGRVYPKIFLKPYENAFLWNLFAFSPTDLIKVPSTSKVKSVLVVDMLVVVKRKDFFLKEEQNRTLRRR